MVPLVTPSDAERMPALMALWRALGAVSVQISCSEIDLDDIGTYLLDVLLKFDHPDDRHVPAAGAQQTLNVADWDEPAVRAWVQPWVARRLVAGAHNGWLHLEWEVGSGALHELVESDLEIDLRERVGEDVLPPEAGPLAHLASRALWRGEGLIAHLDGVLGSGDAPEHFRHFPHLPAAVAEDLATGATAHVAEHPEALRHIRAVLRAQVGAAWPTAGASTRPPAFSARLGFDPRNISSYYGRATFTAQLCVGHIPPMPVPEQVVASLALHLLAHNTVPEARALLLDCLPAVLPAPPTPAKTAAPRQGRRLN